MTPPAPVLYGFLRFLTASQSTHRVFPRGITLSNSRGERHCGCLFLQPYARRLNGATNSEQGRCTSGTTCALNHGMVISPCILQTMCKLFHRLRLDLTLFQLPYHHCSDHPKSTNKVQNALHKPSFCWTHQTPIRHWMQQAAGTYVLSAWLPLEADTSCKLLVWIA